MRRFLILLVAALLLGVLSAPLMAQDAQTSGAGYIRVANLTSSTRTIVVFINGEVRLSGLRFENITRWIDFAPGTYEITISRNSNIANAFFTGSVEVTTDSYTTIATRGTNNLTASIISESLGDIPAGSARVTVLHGIEGAAPFNVLVNGAAVVTLLAYPGTVVDLGGSLNDGVTSIDVPAGTYDLGVAFNGDPLQRPFINLPGTELSAGMSYFVAAIGSPNAPASYVSATNPTPLILATGPEGGIASIALGSENFSTLVAAIGAADPAVAKALISKGPFTVFAPTNDAFAATLKAAGLSADDVLANQDLLTTILSYHVVRGSLTSDIILPESEVNTLLPDAKLELAKDADGKITVNGSVNVTTADISASNGIVHVIDRVLLPQAVLDLLGVSAIDEGDAEAASASIAEIALGNPDFSTLVSAVLAADPSVLETLTSGAEFTVFAPTNDAFAKTLAELGLSANDVLANTELLTDILLYHVVRGKLTSDRLVSGASVTTLNGARIKIKITDGVVTLNDTVTVTMADIEASDGVIHAIDGVLIPPQ